MVKFLDEAGLIRYTEKLKNLLAGKQDKLEGAGGQVVGFDSSGKAVPQGTESLRGPAGKDGTDGTDGKTAYQYAVDGGYTGTEEEFKELMGTGPWLPISGGTITGPFTCKDVEILSKKFSIERSETGSAIISIVSKGNYYKTEVTPTIKFFPPNSVVEESFERKTILRGVATPIYDNDAANKRYVDLLIAGLEARIAALEAK